MSRTREARWICGRTVALLGVVLSATALQAEESGGKAPDLSVDPTLYMVGYAHLDTQWRWAYPRTINQYIPDTLHDNFALLDKYPEYVFNFSGSNRYRMMKEYYPADYARMKEYVGAGRWFPCGSSVEECDVLAPGPESIIRQVLLGNEFFRTELGRTSAEFMLPDCFGFPASLPDLLAHCGIKGFSTQKLTWGSANGIPFPVGIWEGPGGGSVIAAFNAGAYVGTVEENLARSDEYLARVNETGERSGLFTDYRYYGVGDVGGAPTEGSVQWIERSVADDGPLRVVSATAEQMFLDLGKHSLDRLPRYKGELLLTEHSAGSITSQAYMKRWNRRNELLADAAECASVLAEWLGGPEYPRRRLNDAWTLVLGAQFHDILPGTSLPQCYTYSWNDELLAMNQFAGVIESAVGSIASILDTRADGAAIVVFNPLSAPREDVVEAWVRLPGGVPDAVRVRDSEGREIPSQILARKEDKVQIAFSAKAPSLGFAVYDVQAATKTEDASSTLSVSESSLESEHYRVTLNGNGDVSSIVDKKLGRDLLSGPMRPVFLPENPRSFPAWNMDWTDRQKEPLGYVEGPAKVRIVERGPVRVALEIERRAGNSRFKQTIRLSAGAAGDRVEFLDVIDWRGRECCLKTVFPLAAENPVATYNWGVGTIERGNNDPKKYEVPTHRWLDVTDRGGEFGTTILTGYKYGSDKPDDRTIRLTLLYTPGTQGGYHDQATQDWGRHEILYGLAGHAGDWRTGKSHWSGLRLDQPLQAFQCPSHGGPLGRSFSLLKLSEDGVRVLAMKKAERSDDIILRLVELDGRADRPVHVSMVGPIAAAREVDGQERPIGDARLEEGKLITRLGPYQIRSFAVKLGQPPVRVRRPSSRTVELPFDRCVTSVDGVAADGGFDAAGRCIPAEMLPSEIEYGSVRFLLAPPMGTSNAVQCKGQTVALPSGDFDRVYVLAAASDGPRDVVFKIDDAATAMRVRDWRAHVGQWDQRVWQGELPEMAYGWTNPLEGLRPGYVHEDPVGWYCSHHHDAEGRNRAYEYCYLYVYGFHLPAGARTLTLPEDERVMVLAASVGREPSAGMRTARPLIEQFDHEIDTTVRIAPPGGRFDDCTSVSFIRPDYSGGLDVRYTLDGSEPAEESPRYEGPFMLAAPTTVKAALFGPDGRTGEIATASLEIEDVTAPTVTGAAGCAGHPGLIVRFSEPLDAKSAQAPGNYRVGGGVDVRSAALQPDGRTVFLGLSSAPPADGTVVVDGVRDRSPSGNAIKGARPVDLKLYRPVMELPATMCEAGEHRRAEGEPSAGAETIAGGMISGPLESLASAKAVWTMSFRLRAAQQPEDYTVIAGIGDCGDSGGTQRYICKFPHGLHFWGSHVDVPAGAAIEPGRWQAVAAAFDGTTVRLFVDGRQTAEQRITLRDAAPVVRFCPPAPWRHGHDFEGEVSDFVLFDAALPADAIAVLHGNLAPPNE